MSSEFNTQQIPFSHIQSLVQGVSITRAKSCFNYELASLGVCPAIYLGLLELGEIDAKVCGLWKIYVNPEKYIYIYNCHL